MYLSETIQNCKNPTGHIDTLKNKEANLHEIDYDIEAGKQREKRQRTQQKKKRRTPVST